MNENGMAQGDEISLFDLWQKLREGWQYLAGGAVLGLVGAGGALAVLPPKYEAVALVQVGQVGQVAQAGPLPVETPAQAAERLKSPSFQLEVAKKLGHEDWVAALSASSSAATRYVTIQVMKTVPVIELKASARSPEQARAIADAVIQDLASKHAEIARPMLEKMRADLGITKEKLTTAERELAGLNKMATGVGIKDERFTQLSLIASLRVQKEAEIFGLRQNILAYETALMPPATQMTKALETIYAAGNPVSPKRSLLFPLGGIGGLFAGVVLLFVANAWRREAPKRELNQAA